MPREGGSQLQEGMSDAKKWQAVVAWSEGRQRGPRGTLGCIEDGSREQGTRIEPRHDMATMRLFVGWAERVGRRPALIDPTAAEGPRKPDRSYNGVMA